MACQHLGGSSTAPANRLAQGHMPQAPLADILDDASACLQRATVLAVHQSRLRPLDDLSQGRDYPLPKPARLRFNASVVPALHRRAPTVVPAPQVRPAIGATPCHVAF